MENAEIMMEWYLYVSKEITKKYFLRLKNSKKIGEENTYLQYIKSLQKNNKEWAKKSLMQIKKTTIPYLEQVFKKNIKLNNMSISDLNPNCFMVQF